MDDGFQNSTRWVFTMAKDKLSRMFSSWVLEHPGQVLEFSEAGIQKVRVRVE